MVEENGNSSIDPLTEQHRNEESSASAQQQQLQQQQQQQQQAQMAPPSSSGAASAANIVQFIPAQNIQVNRQYYDNSMLIQRSMEVIMNVFYCVKCA